MTSYIPRPYLRLRGSEYNNAGLRPSSDVALDDLADLEKPRIGSDDFRTYTPPPQYAAVHRGSEDVQSEQRLGPLNTGWQPPFLRPLTLLAFALLFLVFFGSLQLVWSWSQGHQGIATSDDSKHYLWTFGPTAVLVIVTVGWRQVDYAAKSLQPWADMAKGAASAERSLLLDYITPIQPVAFVRALRYRHFVVASTIAVFSLLKTMTIISTGLFSLDQVKVNSTESVMQLSSRFTGETYDHAASVDSRPVYAVYGVQSLNLSYPPGTTAQHAVQLFSPQDQSFDGLVSHTAVADVFSASLDCEVGKHVTYTNSSDFDLTDGFQENTPVSQYFNTSLITSDCQIHNAHLDAPSWFGNGTYFGYYALMQNVTCSNLAENDPKKRRVMFAVAYSERTSQDVQAMLNSSTVVCVPSYSIQPATVTLGRSNIVQGIHFTGESPRQLPGVSGYDLALGVMAASSQAAVVSSAVSGYGSSNFTNDVFFDLISVTAPNNSYAHSLLDPTLLETSAKVTYSKIAAQVASRYLLVQDATLSSAQSETLTGSVIRNEPRLQARQLPLRLMQGIALVMFSLTTLVLFVMQTNVLPQSPDSLAFMAAVMARSPSVTSQLKDSGHMDMDKIRSLLSDQKFSSVLHNVGGTRSFSVQATGGHSQHNGIAFMKELDTGPIRWIRPFSQGYPAKTLALIGPITVIAVLEVTLRLSNSNTGLADVNGDSWKRYAWLYVPTLTLVLLGTLFNVLDFDIEISEPYYRLSRGYTSARSSVFQGHLRRIPIATTFHALRNKRWALLAASISILLAPTLTIISSGLFTVQMVPLNVTLDDTRMLDWFNTTGAPNADQDSKAGLVGSMIIQGNMSYPAWTYESLTLPRIVLGSDNSGARLEDGTVLVKTPALRGQPGCTVVPKDKIISVVVMDGGVKVNISTSPACGNSGYIGHGTPFIQGDLTVPTTGYFGMTTPLAVDIADCAHLVVFYGNMVNSKLENLTTLLCSPYVERVEVNVTLNVFDLSIASPPPQIIPNTASHFSSWSADYLYMLFQNINISSSNIFDNFIDAVVWGQTGIPASELTDPDTLIAGISSVYGQMVAPMLDYDFRSSFANLPQNQTNIPSSSLQGTHTTPTRTRLVQSNLSTRLLQAVLAALLLCAIVAFLLMDMRKVLPKEIGSIAAAASLLAGSDLLEEYHMPPGAEWWSIKEWKRRGVWKDDKFRMGWWDDGAGAEVDNTAGEVGGRSFRIDVKPPEEARGLRDGAFQNEIETSV